MHRILEYRLNDPLNDYPAIYHFKDLDPMQIFCRRSCDYFVIEGSVYEVTSTALEHDRFVIYLNPDKEEQPFASAVQDRPLGIEIRLYEEYKESPEFMYISCFDHVDVFSRLDSTYLTLRGKEYERISAEMDQDRRVYVLYVKETGE
ncbi:hypothetical protein [Bacillus sp. SJS]|uniref:hypothetical protein n=1 Tax=Bacillus sp. SJS TaxID=1423321 RepID=UPI0004DD0F77|nr:hypothetical protein [Bacillus sp. SJS]KZZ83936.1 hypothetical protein AS29_014415 [Bacillus sp. SJS]